MNDTTNRKSWINVYGERTQDGTVIIYADEVNIYSSPEKAKKDSKVGCIGQCELNA